MSWKFNLLDGSQESSDSLIAESSLKVSYNQVGITGTIAEYTTRSGGSEVGTRREGVGTLSIEYQSLEASEGIASDINMLYKWCKFIDYLENEDGLKLYVSPRSPSTKSPQGSRGKYAVFSCTFKTIKPYWEAEETTQEETISGTAVTRFDVISVGTANVNPQLSFLIDEGEELDSLVFTNTLTSQSMQLSDLGLTGDGVNPLLIDCSEGTITCNSVDLISKIVSGSGFLEFQPFTNPIEVTSDAPGELTTSYKEGYYFA